MVSTSGSVEYLCAGARGFINVAHSVAGSLRIFRSRPPGPVNLLCMAQSAGIMHDSLLRICAAEDTNTRLGRSEEHTSELQSPSKIVCRLLLEKKNNNRPGEPDERASPTSTTSRVLGRD